MSACLVRAEPPLYIKVADKPPNLGGIVTHISVAEFGKRFGCVYNDGIDIAPGTRIGAFQENITGSLTSLQLRQQVEKVLRTTNNALAICDMGPWGYGTFALEKIPANTVVAIFAGTLTEKVHITDPAEFGSQYYGTNLMFSSKNHRGLASFMQHLPEAPKHPDAKTFSQLLRLCGQDVSENTLKLNIELYSTTFDAEIMPRLAMENIRKEFINYQGAPVIAMVTSREIERGEPVGFNYSYLYWQSRKVTPEFFDKNGNTLSHTMYKRTFGKIQFNDFSYTGDYGSLIASLNQGQRTLKILGDDQKFHTLSWENLAESLLSVNACELRVNLLKC